MQFFGENKFYFFVGFSGQIGQLVVEWMVKNGVGCVCLISCFFKVDFKWFEVVQFIGVIVKIYVMDVIDKVFFEKVVVDI